MGCACIRQSPLSTVGFAAIREDLARQGVRVSGALAGSVEAPNGFVVAWNYHPEESVLYLSIDGSNLLIGFAWDRLEAVILPHVG
jgi:hypothetical protein